MAVFGLAAHGPRRKKFLIGPGGYRLFAPFFPCRMYAHCRIYLPCCQVVGPRNGTDGAKLCPPGSFDGFMVVMANFNFTKITFSGGIDVWLDDPL